MRQVQEEKEVQVIQGLCPTLSAHGLFFEDTLKHVFILLSVDIAEYSLKNSAMASVD